MTGYTRLTLVGSTRRVDVVMPDDEPVGRLLPEALQLTGEPPASPAAERRLALLDGRLLESDLSLADADVADGAVVRIVGLPDAPPPPVVLDVTEEAAADREDRSWLWGSAPRRWLATALAVAATVAAMVTASPLLGDRRDAAFAIVAGGLLLAGAALGRFWSSVAGTTVILSAAAAGLYAITQQGMSGWPAVAATAGLVAVTVLALGVGSSMGRGGVIGGVLSLLLLGCWLLTTRLLSTPQAVACLAVLTVVLLGLLPRLAAMLAGLTSLDDRRAREEPVRRRDVRTALQATHRGLALATVAVAASALAAGVRLAFAGSVWTTLLAVLLLVVLAIRVRAFPLIPEVVALAVALAGIGVALLLAWLRSSPEIRPALVAALVLAALVGVVLPLLRPSPQLRARGRVLTDRLEVAAVVAMLPVLVGVFGVYPRLLASF